MIFLAPFAVGMGTHLVMRQFSGVELDIFAISLYFIGLFLFFALFPQIVSAKQCCPFRVTWWAISFPLGAMCISALKIALVIGNQGELEHFRIFFDFVGILLSVFITIVFIWLIYRTMSGILRDELKNLA